LAQLGTPSASIGHGVDVMYERDAAGLLAEMRERHVAVEINFTSNYEILGVRGDQHPFPVYFSYGVLTVLSTDDKGIGRTHLIQEYERAVLTYKLRYADFKKIVRNSIEYSFAPGASYWKIAYAAPVSQCAGGEASQPCQAFLQSNEKAPTEADLERQFAEFERTAIKH
jgi:adenosine deaminase